MTRINAQYLLARRPAGKLGLDSFQLEKLPVPELCDGQLLIQIRFLSLDPYMRGRMDTARSYAPPWEVGSIMRAGAAGDVIESKHPDFAVGDQVVGIMNWQRYHVSSGEGLNKVDTRTIPLSAYLGAVGLTGVTAHYGVHAICKPKAGETFVVSAAAGAVGSVAGQLAKLAGCRVVGVAGGPQKCAHVLDDLGFDACVDYKAGDLEAQLTKAAPEGIDCVFENVGGAVFDAELDRMNPFGRIALCGLLASYEGDAIPLRNTRAFLASRLTMRGYIIYEHMDWYPRALGELGALVASGRLKYRETIAHGLEHAPHAFIGMLHGQSLGKQLVDLGQDDGVH